MNFIPNTEFAAAQSQVLDKRSSGSRCLLLLLRVLQSVSLYSLFLAVHFCLYPSQFVFTFKLLWHKGQGKTAFRIL